MSLIFLYIIIVLSAVIHEYSHGLMAYELGDHTAKDEGRLTLNPLAHLDPIGTVLVPIFSLTQAGFFIGWAKPVPFNPYNLRDIKKSILKIALAGPLSNLAVATILGVFFRIIRFWPVFSPIFGEFLGLIIQINISLAFFNLMPFPPFDGSKIFSSLFPKAWSGVMRLGNWGIIFGFLLAMAVLPTLIQTTYFLITGIS